MMLTDYAAVVSSGSSGVSATCQRVAKDRSVLPVVVAVLELGDVTAAGT